MFCFQGLKTAIIEGDVVGGTCVNRGCVPSKALLAVSGRMRELQNEHHMKAFGLQVGIFGLVLFAEKPKFSLLNVSITVFGPAVNSASSS